MLNIDDSSSLEHMIHVNNNVIAVFLSHDKVAVSKGILSSSFSKIANFLYKMCCRNGLPTNNESYGQKLKGRIVYKILKVLPFNFGRVVFDHLFFVVQNPESKLWLPYHNQRQGGGYQGKCKLCGVFGHNARRCNQYLGSANQTVTTNAPWQPRANMVMT